MSECQQNVLELSAKSQAGVNPKNYYKIIEKIIEKITRSELVILANARRAQDRAVWIEERRLESLQGSTPRSTQLASSEGTTAVDPREGAPIATPPVRKFRPLTLTARQSSE